MSISDYLENKILDKVLRGDDFTGGTTWVSLHDADPGEDGSNEISGGSYARQSGTFSAATGGTGTSANNIVYSDMPSGTVSHVGLWDTDSGGNFWWGGSLVASKNTNEGDTFQINSGDLDVALD
jgi:hypothetical protein